MLICFCNKKIEFSNNHIIHDTLHSVKAASEKYIVIQINNNMFYNKIIHLKIFNDNFSDNYETNYSLDNKRICSIYDINFLSKINNDIKLSNSILNINDNIKKYKLIQLLN